MSPVRTPPAYFFAPSLSFFPSFLSFSSPLPSFLPHTQLKWIPSIKSRGTCKTHFSLKKLVSSPFPPLLLSSLSSSFVRDVEKTYGMADALHSSWKQLLARVNTSSDDEFLWTTKELTSTLQGLKEDLLELEEAVQAMAKNPAAFKLTPRDVQGRQEFVSNMRKQVADITADMGSPASRAKLDKDKREALLEQARKSDMRRRAQERHDQANQDFIDHHSPQVLIKEQDRHLGQLDQTVQKLKMIATTIGTTLDEDAQHLHELEYRVDNSLSKLKTANKKADKLLKQV